MNSIQSLLRRGFDFVRGVAARIGVPAPTIKTCTSPRDFQGGPRHSSRLENSNGCRCEFIRFWPCRFMTRGPSICPLTTGPRLLGLLSLIWKRVPLIHALVPLEQP